MQDSSLPVRGQASRKANSQRPRESHGNPSRTSSAVLQTRESTPSTRSLLHLTSTSRNSTRRRSKARSTLQKLLAAENSREKRESASATSSQPPTKLPGDRDGSRYHDDHDRYLVTGEPSVLETIVQWGLENDDFEPTLLELLDVLERDPKQFPPKRDDLEGARAAHLMYRGKKYVAVFDADDDVLEVYLWSLDEHNAAYRTAERRRR